MLSSVLIPSSERSRCESPGQTEDSWKSGVKEPSSTGLFIDGVTMGAADDRGRFRVEQNGFSPSACEVSVSDGVDSAVVVFDPCSVPPEFTALEVEPSEGPLGVPATLHANPVIDSTAVPGDLPQGSIVSVEIEGVVNGVDGPGNEWRIGTLPHLVYASPDTRIDDIKLVCPRLIKCEANVQALVGEERLVSKDRAARCRRNRPDCGE